MFVTNDMYLTPPQTPIVINDKVNDYDVNDDLHLELVALNFLFEKKNEKQKTEKNDSDLFIRKDLMWGFNSENMEMANDTSTQCYEKKLRTRALITPLIFSSCIKPNDDSNSKENESYEEKEDFLDYDYHDILLSPADTESSEDEVDVVGSYDGTSFRQKFPTLPNASLFQSTFELDSLEEKSYSDNSEAVNYKTRFDLSDTSENNQSNEKTQIKGRANENSHKNKRRTRKTIFVESNNDIGLSLSKEFNLSSNTKTTRRFTKSHNSSEKKRRDILKIRFHELRRCVPELEDYEKAPKITILNQASELIYSLYQDEEKLLDEYKNEVDNNSKLKKKLELLNEQLTTHHLLFPITFI